MRLCIGISVVKYTRVSIPDKYPGKYLQAYKQPDGPPPTLLILSGFTFPVLHVCFIMENNVRIHI